MELATNLLYLLVCLGMAGVWSWCVARQAQPRDQWGRSLGALVLVCLLLFPAISATDDLQASVSGTSIAALEDAHKHGAAPDPSVGAAVTFLAQATLAQTMADAAVVRWERAEWEAHVPTRPQGIYPPIAHRPPPAQA